MQYQELLASLISADVGNYLALLKVKGEFTPIPLGDVRDVGLGEAVMTIGFPNIQVQGFSPKLTRGEISALRGIQDDPRVFQISVPLQPGNSGGPLIDSSGNAIGITTAQLDALTALKFFRFASAECELRAQNLLCAAPSGWRCPSCRKTPRAPERETRIVGNNRSGDSCDSADFGVAES